MHQDLSKSEIVILIKIVILHSMMLITLCHLLLISGVISAMDLRLLTIEILILMIFRIKDSIEIKLFRFVLWVLWLLLLEEDLKLEIKKYAHFFHCIPLSINIRIDCLEISPPLLYLEDLILQFMQPSQLMILHFNRGFFWVLCINSKV